MSEGDAPSSRAFKMHAASSSSRYRRSRRIACERLERKVRRLEMPDEPTGELHDSHLLKVRRAWALRRSPNRLNDSP